MSISGESQRYAEDHQHPCTQVEEMKDASLSLHKWGTVGLKWTRLENLNGLASSLGGRGKREGWVSGYVGCRLCLLRKPM